MHERNHIISQERSVPIGVSARHIHLCAEHLELLFGHGYALTPLKLLSQPGQYASAETVAIHGPSGSFPKVRILGPLRASTQVEISRHDAFLLGVEPIVRESGRHDNTPGVLVIGPKGQLQLERGTIIAARHLHIHTSEASAWGIRDKELLLVRLNGDRPLILEDVIARVSDKSALDLHIDTDEANAAGVKTGDRATIIRGYEYK
ncbi:MAG: pduL2 [Paenibacillus sp.]|jgi:putative phosphotransacetylase|nr:pduL2 [Paenibacillus sp.]